MAAETRPASPYAAPTSSRRHSTPIERVSRSGAASALPDPVTEIVLGLSVMSCLVPFRMFGSCAGIRWPGSG